MSANDRIFLAYLDGMQSITILLPLTYHNGLSSSFILTSESFETPLEIKEKLDIEDYIKYVCSIPAKISFGKTYWIKDEYGGRSDLQIGAVIRTAQFDEEFYYQGSDLGVSFSNGETRFKLWAPTATQVKVKLQPPDSPYFEIIKMKRCDNGVWEAAVERDLEYFRYSFLVLINREWREAADPYAISATPNGEFGVIVRMDKTKLLRPDLPPFEHPVDAIIYETHIRDFTIHPQSGVINKGLYSGASEADTKGADGKPTGLSYLKELGITHIEFLPFHDFAGVDELDRSKEYNWGYNPVHFNVPDGSYCSDPQEPYSRIMELKQMIHEIHQHGLRVIMDAVYNHVFIRETSAFEKIVPGYFFRHNEYGMPSNGTGVGNDIASERLMARKFILDSVRFWLEEYQVDGLRFDLMGILDVETMNEVRALSDAIVPGSLLIGEGWDLNTPLPPEKKATIRNQSSLPGIGQFNDWFRDAIKGSTFNLYDKGFAMGNEHYYDAAKEVLTGSIGFRRKENALFSEPAQSVNYVEAHDNHTLWDKLLACFEGIDDCIKKKYHRLATSMVFLSQGIPFLHSGQEFFRTKNGIGNSYRSPDCINQLDWERKSENENNVQYISGIIQIRKFFECFRIRTAEEIRERTALMELPIPMIGFQFRLASENCEWDEILFLINPLQTMQQVKIPEGEWTVFADENRAGIEPLRIINSGFLTMEPLSLAVLGKKITP
ncbi:type I pullulanase [Neobacillus sp. PS3-34]|uniref:type I pullulanase n=1 Tax=Neobacillus sp. PS3-34 TaxID=3070678 RepID=UPI0027E0B0BB|nr:type I pullulanase [Neobacillus sp. PS3-34]WML47262.1 type I pullulanase [Neobacillus sp. PS3-34]